MKIALAFFASTRAAFFGEVNRSSLLRPRCSNFEWRSRKKSTRAIFERVNRIALESEKLVYRTWCQLHERQGNLAPKVFCNQCKFFLNLKGPPLLQRIFHNLQEIRAASHYPIL